MRKSMMLIKSTWNTGKTFRLIPIAQECPFNECIYDPEQKVLAVINRDKKDTFQMVPRFDDKGDVVYLKNPRSNGKKYAEERRALETYSEYYLEEDGDVRWFLEYFTANEDAIPMAIEFLDAPKPAQIANVNMFEGTSL